MDHQRRINPYQCHSYTYQNRKYGSTLVQPQSITNGSLHFFTIGFFYKSANSGEHQVYSKYERRRKAIPPHS